MFAVMNLMVLSILAITCQSQHSSKFETLQPDQTEIQVLQQQVAQLKNDLQKSRGKVPYK